MRVVHGALPVGHQLVGHIDIVFHELLNLLHHEALGKRYMLQCWGGTEARLNEDHREEPLKHAYALLPGRSISERTNCRYSYQLTPGQSYLLRGILPDKESCVHWIC